MGLYVTSYQRRMEVVEDASHIGWSESGASATGNNYRWEGHVTPILKGGMPYGGKTRVVHVERTDVDPQDDVPDFGPPADDNVAYSSWTIEHSGTKLYRIEGELWRNEWIEPSTRSPIVRGDEQAPNVFFITDAEGNQQSGEALQEERRWLWFRPEVMCALAHRRGGSLSWYTRDTGGVACSPDTPVPFGINGLGLINVYAKDIGLLDEWEQRIWSGYNVGPDGGVSKELLAAQVKEVPAETQAPEGVLRENLSRLDHLARTKWGVSILKEHEQIPQLIEKTHRFRATDKDGLYALAKDLVRLTAEYLNTGALRKLVPCADRQWGSLKLLEKLLGTIVGVETAKKEMGPLFGIYDLRLRDAHLSREKTEKAFNLVGVDQEAPYVIQGYQLIRSCVGAIRRVCQALERSLGEGHGDSDSTCPRDGVR